MINIDFDSRQFETMLKLILLTSFLIACLCADAMAYTKEIYMKYQRTIENGNQLVEVWEPLPIQETKYAVPSYVIIGNVKNEVIEIYYNHK